MNEPTIADLAPRTRVAIADGGALQGERGRVVEVFGDGVFVELEDAPMTVFVGWWKDVQIIGPPEPAE